MNFAERVQAFFAKSFTGGEDPDQEDEQENEAETEENTGDDIMDKSLVDATEVFGALVTELRDIKKSLKTLEENQKTFEKSQNDVGEAVVSVSELVARIAGTPVSPKSVMAKGNLGGSQPAAQPVVAPTQAEFERAQDILVKAVAAGEITLLKSEMISSSMQKAMVIPGFRMNPEDYDFLVRKMQAA